MPAEAGVIGGVTARLPAVVHTVMRATTTRKVTIDPGIAAASMICRDEGASVGTDVTANNKAQ